MDQLPNMIYLASIWVIPLVIAITFHEAAHGFVAHFLGDDTAWKLGRVIPLGTLIRLGRSCCRASYSYCTRRSCSVMPSRCRSIFEHSEIRAAEWSG